MTSIKIDENYIRKEILRDNLINVNIQFDKFQNFILFLGVIFGIPSLFLVYNSFTFLIFYIIWHILLLLFITISIFKRKIIKQITKNLEELE